MGLTSMKQSEQFRGLARAMLDALFPPECPSCRAAVETMHNLCSDCFRQLHLISTPLCDCCGIPFAVPMEPGMQCPQCLAEPPHFTKARSVMVYDGISAPLITALKFHDQWAGLARYDAMLSMAGTQLLADVDFIAPIPLHWRRLWQRKYNQSALLAYGVAARTQKTCVADLLLRTRFTPPQMRLKRAERLKNVQRAFAVNPRHMEMVKDKKILLVDDVMTTGATANVCAKALRKAGAREVCVLTLARTVIE